ncbi:NAD-binding protein [Williamsia maris]|uniref:Trk K+ transport system, NAD-binding component n=1 Tax=Williamsia maris TaxID=72806 RepID=A0ABT1HG29_9NOCA|nr:NAD-binding protein [Williamsia maris]MCP2175950.1 Trk K+ transport system, NAD-binding component [Williamsia maris]
MVEGVDGTGKVRRSGHVIVCGCTGLATRIIDQFLASGESVSLVVRQADTVVDAAVARWRVRVHTAGVGIGDALTAAGIDTAIAVVCVEDNELWNLESALIATRLNPEVRVITQLGNATVGGAMNDGSGPGVVLDVADLAAPSVVEACLGISTHHLDVAGIDFVAAAIPVTSAGSLRESFGDLAPLAVAAGSSSSPGARVVTCPGRDHPVRPGDVATMLGTADEFVARGFPIGIRPRTARASEPGPVLRAKAGIRGFVEDANPNFFRMLGVLFTLLVLSTTVLRLGYQKPGMSVLDAIYFSTETVATVGYGDFNFADQPPLLRIWSIVLMFAGLTTTAMIMAFLAELLISRRIAEAAGRRKARFMDGHIVVIGLGAFGIRVARELQARGRDVVVIERSRSNRFMAAADELGVPVVIGDATVPQTLTDARVESASAVAVLTSDDMVNVETGIAVRSILGDRWSDSVDHPGVPVVLRIFDRSMGDAVAERFGFHHVRSTAELAAPWFIGAALGLTVLGTFSVQSQSFMVGRVGIVDGGGLVGVAMQDLSATTRVIALRRAATGEVEYPPRRGTAFAAGDDAYVVGPYEELLAVLEHQRAAARVGRLS